MDAFLDFHVAPVARGDQNALDYGGGDSVGGGTSLGKAETVAMISAFRVSGRASFGLPYARRRRQADLHPPPWNRPATSIIPAET